MKLDRLLEMTILLMNRERMTADELARRFGVSTRTIYRDIDTLSLAGIPVYSVKGNGGGISLMGEYTLNKSIVTEEERDEILVGLQSLRAADYPGDDTLIEKLSSLFKSDKNYDWLEVDFSEWGRGPEDKIKFAGIRDSAIERNVIQFIYANSYGEQNQRTVEPLRMVYKARSWYLYGWDRDKQAFRIYRLSRIKNLLVKGEAFEPRENVPDLIENSPPDMVLTKTKLLVSPQLAYRAYDEFDDAALTRMDDGSVEINSMMPVDEWLYSFLLSFGNGILVLEPDFLREEVIDRMMKTLINYGVVEHDIQK